MTAGRAGFVIGGAVVVLGLFLLLRDGGERAAESSSPGAEPPSVAGGFIVPDSATHAEAVGVDAGAAGGTAVVVPVPKLVTPPPVDAGKAIAAKPPSLLGGEHGAGTPAGDPAIVDRFLASHSKEELRIVGLMARNEVKPPPEMKELFELRRKGASTDELIAFVRQRFPDNMRLKLLTVEWIEGMDPNRPKTQIHVAPGGRKPQATIEQVPVQVPAQSPPQAP